MHKIEQKLWSFLHGLSPRAHGVLFKKRTALAFIVAGGVAVVVDTGVLYVCKDIFGLNLISAVAVGFFAGFCSSFLLQKFWTFQDRSVGRMHTQAFLYFVIAVANFFLTELSMYFLVEIVHVWYILAKILVAGGIACVTFFIYKFFIFKVSV